MKVLKGKYQIYTLELVLDIDNYNNNLIWLVTTDNAACDARMDYIQNTCAAHLFRFEMTAERFTSLF